MATKRRPRPQRADLRALDGEIQCGRVTVTTTDGHEYVCTRAVGHENGCAGEWREATPIERVPDWRERQAGER